MLMSICEQQKVIFPDEVIPRKGQQITIEFGGEYKYAFLITEITSIDWVRHNEKGLGALIKMRGVLGDRI